MTSTGHHGAAVTNRGPAVAGLTGRARLAQQLAYMERCIVADGLAPSGEVRQLRELSERLDTGQFHLAVLGQFKRGKSTLINALVGGPVLPISVVPLTSIPTFIRLGDSSRVRVSFEDGRKPMEFTACTVEERAELLTRFVTESGNPHNRLGVTVVDVYLPSPLLAEGVVLIDTPGIGSTYQHNTEVTLNFLKQCDAALFLSSADPPLTQVEVEFLCAVREKVQRLFFAFNKIDYLNAEERTVALDFLRKTLTQHLHTPDIGPIFAVSARQGLQARSANDKDLWRASGLEDLEMHLIDFLACEKAAALENAVSRKAANVAESALMHVRLAIRSLELPQADLDERLASFELGLAKALQERLVFRDLLAGDKRRMQEYLEEQTEALRRKSRLVLAEAVRELPVDATSGNVDELAAQKVLAETIPVFFERSLGTLTQRLDARVASVLAPHLHRVDDLVEQVRRTAAALFDIPYPRVENNVSLESWKEPYWITHKWDTSFSPMPENWLDHFLPKRFRKMRAARRLSEKIEGLVIQNVENLRWATLQNLDRTFTRLEARLDECLEETISATKGAIQSANAKRTAQTDSVSAEVSRLRATASELEFLIAELTGSEPAGRICGDPYSHGMDGL